MFQEIDLLLGLDTLTDDVDIHFIRHVDNARKEYAFLLLNVFTGEEALIDLEHINGHTLQKRQRRISGAEVVDRYLEALLAEQSESSYRVLLIGDEHTLGKLKLDKLGVYPIAANDLDEVVDEVVFEHVDTRDIDGYRNDRHSGIYPAAQVFADFLINKEVDVYNVAVLFEERNEAVGCDYRAVRLYPAHKCLCADDIVMRNGDFRLEEHFELAVLKSAHSVTGYLDSPVELLTHLRFIYAAYSDAVRFREFEREVRVVIAGIEAERGGHIRYIRTRHYAEA